MSKMDSLFLRRAPLAPRIAPSPVLDERYAWTLWRPSLTCIAPKGVRRRQFVVDWLLHNLRLFRNRDYGILAVYDGERLIHRSSVFPKWLRFPFMAANDLQIARTWTDENYRGKGLAVFAVDRILECYARPDRTFWYLVQAKNAPSIRVAEKCGFSLYGKGSRVSRCGCRALGCFQIEEYV